MAALLLPYSFSELIHAFALLVTAVLQFRGFLRTGRVIKGPIGPSPMFRNKNGVSSDTETRGSDRRLQIFDLKNGGEIGPDSQKIRLHLVRSENIVVEEVTILGDFDTPNNDGIDVEDSNNTVITRCHIDTGDDAICPKSSTGPVRNLTATDCWIRTKSSAIKLGSASTFDFTGFRFDNITIVDSHRGLGLQIRDGGNVSDITFSNINIRTRYYDPSWWGRAEPIYVTTCPRDPTSKVGSISDLRFINISAVSENGVFLSGSEGGLVRNLKFVNVNLTFQRWTNYSDGLFDYRPGCQEMVHHSTAGLMMEHVSGIEMENVKMKWHKNGLKGWNNPLEFRASTVNKLSFRDWFSEES